MNGFAAQADYLVWTAELNFSWRLLRLAEPDHNFPVRSACTGKPADRDDPLLIAFAFARWSRMLSVALRIE